MLVRASLFIVVGLSAVGCASAPAATPPSEPNADRSATGTVYPAQKRWNGTLNPTRSFNGTAVASERQNAYGRAEVTVSANNPSLSRVTLTVTVPNEPGLDVAGWGLSEGRCGSGNPPVLAPSMFAPIQLNSSGQGKVDATIPYVIPDNGTYHINVFRRGGTQLSDVITCGELRRG
ncbi:MAG TPA: hypothetical protein VJ852_08310 [Gemmatimonadaceae bacterium]|nr:hypothetical protein [Gemmatimonadaceae bacterium]